MLSFLLILLLAGCNGSETTRSRQIEVANPLQIDRTNETIEINLEELEFSLDEEQLKDLLVRDESGNVLVSQLVDNDSDGRFDEILFQVSLKANETKKFQVAYVPEGNLSKPTAEYVAYSNFYPNRFDDYAWENNRVAFRTFGPKLQEMTENNIPGGSISSGFDLWLKKVSYSILDDWYKKNEEINGYYHTDRGEGYDPYHVGSSRGTGGIGIWENDSLLVSKNFVSYKTVANGPIRTIFELKYAPWSKYQVNEVKRISLDTHSNFSKVEVSLTSAAPVPNYVVGIFLHDKKGLTKAEQGWIRYWEEIDSTQVGEAIFVDKEIYSDSFVIDPPYRDGSHILMMVEPKDTFVYYAGFEWSEANRVQNMAQWDEIVMQQQRKKMFPLVVNSIKK